MEKLLTKEAATKEVEACKEKLEISEIEKFYLNKKTKTMRFGLEYERLSLDKNTLKNASYEKLSKILEHFCKILNWSLVYDNATIIAARSNSSSSSLSLEPGCQLEISLEAKENIIDIDIELTKIVRLLDKIGALYNVIFLGYGVSPNSSVDEIKILNKERYKIMNDYLPSCLRAELAQSMMRKTAGIQINVDFIDKKDAYLKLKFLNLIMPFMTGLCSNSPSFDFKASRAHIWLFTGIERCNMFYKNIFNKKFFKYSNVFKNYINEVLDVPMIYISRNSKNIALEGKINFREFIKHGFNGFEARLEDYILHQSLCFPDIRLKNYIEIRNHDSSNPQMALALCAFYKGLLKNDISEFLREFEYLKLDDVEKYFSLAIQKGLDFELNNLNAWDIVKKLATSAQNNLCAKERAYLKPILDIIENRKTQADILIEYDIKTPLELVSYLYE